MSLLDQALLMIDLAGRAEDTTRHAQQTAFSSDRTGSGDIYVMNADGLSVRRLTNAPVSEILPA